METDQHNYDVLIIGGSYAGLSAALSLGRARRSVLIIDAGQPCNSQTPHSHNFLTQDGNTPTAIVRLAREQVLSYPTISYLTGSAVEARQGKDGFAVSTGEGQEFRASKLLLATGVKDVFLPIPGLKECWGISVLHCPYCHGYEVRDKKLGIITNGQATLEFVRLLTNWSANSVVLTNGPNALTPDARVELSSLNVSVIDKAIKEIRHDNGKLGAIAFADGDSITLDAVFTRLPFEHHTDLAGRLGCAMATSGHIEVDVLGRTSITGVYAAGDCTTQMRSISVAVASGSTAGAAINRELSGI